jgi:hypothetical protein
MRESTSRLDARGVVPRDVPDDVERGAIQVTPKVRVGVSVSVSVRVRAIAIPRILPDDVERGAVEVKEALLVEDEELDRFGGAHLRRRI